MAMAMAMATSMDNSKLEDISKISRAITPPTVMTLIASTPAASSSFSGFDQHGNSNVLLAGSFSRATTRMLNLQNTQL
jgi:hypothetical protein